MLINIPKSLKDLSKLITGNIIAKIIGFGVLLFYAKILPTEDMAIFPMYLVLNQLAFLIFSFGLFPVLIIELPSLFKKNINQARSLLCTGGLLLVVGTSLVNIIVLLFSSDVAELLFKDDNQSGLIKLMSFGFLATSIGNLAQYVIWANQGYWRRSSLEIMDAVIRPAFAIPLFLFTGTKGLVLGLVIAQIINTLVALFFMREVFLGGFPGFYPLSKLFRKSLPFYLESYLHYFRQNGDHLLVSILLGPSDLGVYYIAKRVFSLFSVLAMSIDRVATERLAQVKNDLKVLSLKADNFFSSLSQAIIPTIFLSISLMPILIPTFFGIKYNKAIVPSCILLAALLIDFLRMPVHRTIYVATKSRNVLLITFIDTIALLLSLIILTPFLGIIGVAGARLISQFCGGASSIWILWKQLRVLFNYKTALISIFSTVPGTFLVLKFFNNPPHELFQSLLVATSGAICWGVIFVIIIFFFNRSLITQTTSALRSYFQWGHSKVSSRDRK